MKIKEKDELRLYMDGRCEIRKEPIEGEMYFHKELRFVKSFPFLKNLWIEYKLIDGLWIEQEDL